MTVIRKIPLDDAFATIDAAWSPRLAAELNGQHVKLAKLRGEFIWHRHDEADELFLVVRGRLLMHLRDGIVELGPGEMLVVPRGVEHKPEAPEEAHVLLFEPVGTLNTGSERSERTVPSPPWLDLGEDASTG
jgi:mannose-6-phosphate isomerase-like protein (cupin superfamily)